MDILFVWGTFVQPTDRRVKGADYIDSNYHDNLREVGIITHAYYDYLLVVPSYFEYLFTNKPYLLWA